MRRRNIPITRPSLKSQKYANQSKIDEIRFFFTYVILKKIKNFHKFGQSGQLSNPDAFMVLIKIQDK